jgi:hypothetical protein
VLLGRQLQGDQAQESEQVSPAERLAVEGGHRHLVRKSSGQFIYAATVIKFLSSGKRIKARLRTILDVGSTSTNGQAELPFRQLDVLYEHILNSAGAGQVEAVKQTTALCILYESCQFDVVCRAPIKLQGKSLLEFLA